MSFNDCDCTDDKEVVDCRLRQHWARKARRHSSEAKSFLGDNLELSEHHRVESYLVKNGKYVYGRKMPFFHVTMVSYLLYRLTPCVPCSRENGHAFRPSHAGEQKGESERKLADDHRSVYIWYTLTRRSKRSAVYWWCIIVIVSPFRM